MFKKRPNQIVAMTCIPGRLERGSQIRSGTDYAKYGQATWKWWCKRHNIEFIVLDRPLGGEAYEMMPPTIQRWLAPAVLVGEHGRSTKIALVDADTMIRWDTPNFFDLSESHLTAVLDTGTLWVDRSIDAYQRLFQGVFLSPSYYFNCGFVIVGEQQLDTLSIFTNFAKDHWAEWSAIQKSGDFGNDQTALNFIACREREHICFLPWNFNMHNCDVPALQELIKFGNRDLAPERSLEILKSGSGVFDFIKQGYVWHFSALYQRRLLLMKETWRRVRKYYPGCEFLD